MGSKPNGNSYFARAGRAELMVYGIGLLLLLLLALSHAVRLAVINQEWDWVQLAASLAGAAFACWGCARLAVHWRRVERR